MAARGSKNSKTDYKSCSAVAKKRKKKTGTFGRDRTEPEWLKLIPTPYFIQSDASS